MRSRFTVERDELTTLGADPTAPLIAALLGVPFIVPDRVLLPGLLRSQTCMPATPP